MAAIGTSVTLMDVARRLDPKGMIDDIAEVIAEKNEILEDMHWEEGNLPTGNLVTIRTGQPAGSWRKLNYGVAQSKSTTQQVTDTAGMLEDYSEVDVDLAKLNGNEKAFRKSEDDAFLHGMSETMADTILYGDTDLYPERLLGFMPRLDDSTAGNGANVIKGGGSGSDNTSVLLVGWGPKSVYGFYPKGSMAGLQMEDLGKTTSVDSNGLMHEVYRSHFQWKAGLTVKDWRYVVRICNIDVSDLSKNGSTGADLIDLMVQALERMEASYSSLAFYCNRTVRSFLRRQITNRNNVNLTFDTVAGKRVLFFDEAPVRRVDAILNTESTVS